MSNAIRSPKTLIVVVGPHFIRFDYDHVVYDDDDNDAIEDVRVSYNGDLLSMLDHAIPGVTDLIETALRRHALSAIS